jgi:hypothetical protein
MATPRAAAIYARLSRELAKLMDDFDANLRNGSIRIDRAVLDVGMLPAT